MGGVLRFVAVALLLLTGNGTANAGGSVSLEDVVNGLAGQSPKLMREIRAELKASGKTVADVVCGGTRLGRHWAHLGGLRIPTFGCTINGKDLTIEGAVHFYDDAGTYDAGPETAKYAVFSNPKWRWSR